LAIVLLAAAPARAQVPAPPEQLAPVFEVVAPIASPVCGNGVLVAAIAPSLVQGQIGMPLPVDVGPVLGPAFVLCGSIPQPPARLTCSADDTVAATFNSVVAAILGAPLPVDTRVVGPAAEQTVVIEDKLPPPLNSQGLSDQVVTTLTCRAEAADETPPPGEEAPPQPPSHVEDSYYDEISLPDLTLGGDDQLRGAFPRSLRPPRAVTAIGAVGGPGFAYPVVFALPLVMIVIGAYFGRSLTQPVERPHR
jgi:hypothetical protein